MVTIQPSRAVMPRILCTTQRLGNQPKIWRAGRASGSPPVITYIHHARSTSTTSNHADSCPTLRLRVHAMYLAAPLHAQAWTAVHTRLSLRLQSDLMGALHGHAMEGLARAERRPGQASSPLHHRLQKTLSGIVYNDRMLTYTTLQDRPREFLAATGLTHAEFAYLLPAFATAYALLSPPAKTLEGTPRRRRAGGGATGTLPPMADTRLLILVFQTTHPLQTLHG